jgi:PadR family transcriptional regulator, regulatory protein AphA
MPTGRVIPLSLRHGLLDLLAGEPMSGYDLARYFGSSMSNIWPAQHSQIYPELGKLVAEGLISQTDEGPRGRKVYETTEAGIEVLRAWMRDTAPDYSMRSEALLRVLCVWVLPTDDALVHLARDRAEFVRHLDVIERAINEQDWSASLVHRSSRLAVESSRRYYAGQIEWIDWASEQVVAGTLQPGGPLPSDSPVPVL